MLSLFWQDNHFVINRSIVWMFKFFIYFFISVKFTIPRDAFGTDSQLNLSRNFDEIVVKRHQSFKWTFPVYWTPPLFYCWPPPFRRKQLLVTLSPLWTIFWVGFTYHRILSSNLNSHVHIMRLLPNLDHFSFSFLPFLICIISSQFHLLRTWPPKIHPSTILLVSSRKRILLGKKLFEGPDQH
jgi:hypothetical protein